MPRTTKYRAWDNVEKKMLSWDEIKPWSLSWLNRYGVDGRTKDYVFEEFTGLHDKDGKEIWEGDIVSFDGNMTADNTMGFEPNGYIFDETSLHEVVWNGEHACWDLRHDEDTEWKYRRDCHGLLIAKKCKTLGNVHENPELINAKN